MPPAPLNISMMLAVRLWCSGRRVLQGHEKKVFLTLILAMLGGRIVLGIANTVIFGLWEPPMASPPSSPVPLSRRFRASSSSLSSSPSSSSLSKAAGRLIFRRRPAILGYIPAAGGYYTDIDDHYNIIGPRRNCLGCGDQSSGYRVAPPIFPGWRYLSGWQAFYGISANEPFHQFLYLGKDAL